MIKYFGTDGSVYYREIREEDLQVGIVTIWVKETKNQYNICLIIKREIINNQLIITFDRSPFRTYRSVPFSIILPEYTFPSLWCLKEIF